MLGTYKFRICLLLEMAAGIPPVSVTVCSTFELTSMMPGCTDPYRAREDRASTGSARSPGTAAGPCLTSVPPCQSNERYLKRHWCLKNNDGTAALVEAIPNTLNWEVNLGAVAWKALDAHAVLIPNLIKFWSLGWVSQASLNKVHRTADSQALVTIRLILGLPDSVQFVGGTVGWLMRQLQPL